MTPGLLASPQSSGVAVTTHTAPADPTPSSDQALVSTLQTSPYTFLQPTPSLHAAALVIAKRYLDPLAASTSEAQTARLQATRKKRKRGEVDDQEARNVLRLQQIHLEGFGIDQVWEQARRVLDATRKETERNLPQILSEDSVNSPAKQDGASKPAKTVRFHEDEGDDEEDSEDRPEGSGDGVDQEESGEHEFSEDDLGDIDMHGDKEEEDEDLEDIEDIEEDSDVGLNEDNETGGRSGRFVKDKHGLNDGFFSIDDFNQATEFLEQQDAKGDPDDGAASDEEDVDWSLNPMSNGLHKSANGKPAESDDEDGPTFGNADLNAPWSDDDDDNDNDSNADDQDVEIDDPTSNTNDIYYTDFFAPPPQAKTKTTRMRALPKTQPSTDLYQPVDDDVQRTISSVRRDIFSDDEISNPSDLDPADANPADDPSLSTHEKRQAHLAAQIRQLEKEAVEKRDWALMGEARAADRPENALLEEDLDFERAGKPVPVATAEATQSTEELIKKRILDRNFDEVVRRRPGAGDLPSNNAAPSARRGLLDDPAAADAERKMGLAEVYEQEHLARTDPNYTSASDKKLQAAHADVERLWKDVAAKLDALSSWHYRPKPLDVQINVVSDAPRVEMEDARPGAASGMTREMGGLAPQEIYKPGDERTGGTGGGGDGDGDGDGGGEEQADVVTKGGNVLAKAELTREQKRRRRNREKERARKRGEEDGRGKKPLGKKAKEKKGVVDELKRGGVKVIGKGGELKDVQGKAAKLASGDRKRGAGGFKL